MIVLCGYQQKKYLKRISEYRGWRRKINARSERENERASFC